MERPTLSRIRELARSDVFPSVSIYMPLHGGNGDIQQDPIRLKNLVKRAEGSLVDRGMRGADARTLLDRVRALESDRSIFGPGAPAGGAFLAGPDGVRVFGLDDGCNETITVGRHFHVTPLLRGVETDGTFLLLALSPKRVALHRCSRARMEPVPLPADLPRNIDDALAGTEIEKSMQHHGTTSGMGRTIAGMFHGQGNPKDDMKVLLQEYYRTVGRRLEKFLANDRRPIVLCAIDSSQPIIREAFRSRNLLEQGVLGSPDEFTEPEMYERARAVVEPHLRGTIERDARIYREQLGTDRVRDSIETILPEATLGRVEVLFTSPEARIWGTYDDEGYTTAVHEGEQPGDTDLVDLAVRRTLATQGAVHVVSREEMPSESLVAASLRW